MYTDYCFADEEKIKNSFIESFIHSEPYIYITNKHL